METVLDAGSIPFPGGKVFFYEGQQSTAELGCLFFGQSRAVVVD